MPDTLARLQAIADDPLAYLAGRGPGAAPAIGYVCSYVPEEVILAAGFHPVRLGAASGPVGPANGSLQSFACSFARALLDGLLVGRWSGLAGVVCAHTCDSLRAAFEAWKVHAPAGTLAHFFNLPARVEGPGVEAYAASEVARLAAFLGRVPGARAVTPEGLAEAGELTAAARGQLDRLARLRSARPDLLPGSSFLAAARAATIADRKEAARLLAALADELEVRAAQSRPPAAGGEAVSGVAALAGTGRHPRVMVSGGFLETEEPLRLVEQSGADIVADDLCLAGRRMAFGTGEAGGQPAGSPPALAGAAPSGSAPADPLAVGFARTAAAYLGRVPCPAKHPTTRRLEWLVSQAREHRVDGVVFLLQKFCESHAFDYPAFRDALEAAGRPCLLLEIEQGAAATGQARTRLEAFVEKLAAQSARGGAAR